MNNFRIYMKVLFLFFLIVILIISVMNYIVNPYSINKPPGSLLSGLRDITSFNYMRMSKPYRIEDLSPKSIILGTSRTGRGISPGYLGFKYKPVYNSALTASKVYEAYRMLQHANCEKGIRQVVFSLDFIQFSPDKKYNSGFAEERLCPEREWNSVKPDFIKSIFSNDATILSLKKLFLQKTGWKYEVFPNGRWIVNSKRHNKVAAKLTDIDFMSTRYGKMPKDFNRYIIEDKDNQFKYFKRILEICYENDIDLIMFISPSHARQWEVVDRLGLMNAWDDWKRNLVKANEALAITYKVTPYPLWDFSGYNKYTTERFPEYSDKSTRMKWYWESSHYNKTLGDILLNVIMRNNEVQDPESEDFGVMLRSANIEQHLKTIRISQKKYQQNHPETVFEMDGLAVKHIYGK